MEGGDTPVVLKHAEVGMTNTAVLDVDIDLIVLQRARCLLERLELGLRIFSGKCSDWTHGRK
jgi:hypothetical protein